MPLKAETDAREETKTSLERMQNFDVESLVREPDLGRNLNFRDVVFDAKRLVEAAKDNDNKEVILTHASACIFGPQATGYSSEGSADAAKATSIIEILGKPFSGGK